MVYKFTGKGLFYVAGFICLISIVLAPVGILFFYMGAKAHIRLENDRMFYKMLTTKEIPYADITRIRLAKPVGAQYKVGYASVNFATVIPLIIEYKGKSTRLSLNFFENSAEIAATLEQKTGLSIEVPE